MPLIHRALPQTAVEAGPRHTPLTLLRFVSALIAVTILTATWLSAETKKPRLTLDEFFNAVDFTKIAV